VHSSEYYLKFRRRLAPITSRRGPAAAPTSAAVQWRGNSQGILVDLDSGMFIHTPLARHIGNSHMKQCSESLCKQAVSNMLRRE
jgi:hypothetical protein